MSAPDLTPAQVAEVAAHFKTSPKALRQAAQEWGLIYYRHLMLKETNVPPPPKPPTP